MSLPMEMYVDPETGFLQSPQADGFSVEKKKAFLKAIEDFPHYSGIRKACDIVNVATSTVFRHAERDHKFRAEWERLRKLFAFRVEDALAHAALDPKRTLDRIVYLRAYMPEKYAPQNQGAPIMNIQINIQGLETAKGRVSTVKNDDLPNVAPTQKVLDVDSVLEDNKVSVDQSPA